MSKVPGVVDLSLEQQMDVPFVRFVLNRPAIARYGLHADDVAEAIETSFAGATVGRIFDRGTAFDLVVKFDPASSADFERIADLPIDTPDGAPVPVRLLADVRREEGPNMILRENVQRRIVDLVQRRRPRSRQRRRRHSSGRRRSRCRCRPATASNTAASSRASRARRSGCWCSASASSPACSCCWCSHSAASRDAVLIMVEPAAGADWRRRRRVPVRRRVERRIHDRVHHAVRHRDAQRHHAGLAHPASDARTKASPISARRSSAAPTSGWSRS